MSRAPPLSILVGSRSVRSWPSYGETKCGSVQLCCCFLAGGRTCCQRGDVEGSGGGRERGMRDRMSTFDFDRTLVVSAPIRLFASGLSLMLCFILSSSRHFAPSSVISVQPNSGPPSSCHETVASDRQR